MKRVFFITLAVFATTGVFGQWSGSTTIEGDIFRNGYIGIGTNSPQVKLHLDKVNGTGIILSTKNAGWVKAPVSRKIQWTNYLNLEAGSIDLLDMHQETTGTDMVFTVKNNTNTLQEAFRINRFGNIGVGISSPLARLHIDKINGTGIILSTKSAGKTNAPVSRKIQWTNYLDLEAGSIDLLDMHQETTGTEMVFTVKNEADILQEVLRINRFGNVGIGTTKPQSLLAVNGTITSKEVKVTPEGWSDFVFEPGYDLPTLEEVEEHIKEHKHLPDVPNEAEVKENGLSLGESNAVLLQKIEELTLYLIEQDKKQKELVGNLEAQQEEIQKLNNKINQLEK